MKSMQIGLALKPSLQSRPAAVVSGHEEGGVSWIKVGKTVSLEHTSAKFSMLNTPLKANIYVAKVRRQESNFLTNAFPEPLENAPESGVVSPQINRGSILTMLAAIYKYSKFYTLQGTVLSIISISLLAVQRFSDFSPSFFLGVLQAILGGMFANSYVAGVNQLSDIEIDKVNKPDLVLASGELPVRIGVLVTSLYAILGFFIGWSVKFLPLKLGIFLWYAFGTVYSVNLPLLRWKRFPVLAAMCIWSVPDVEGDKINGINSFALQFGNKRVFWICVWLLEIKYGMGILVGLSSTRFWILLLMVIGRSIFGFTLWKKANLVDLDSKEATESFYRFIWKLYCAEYLLVPVLRF